MNADKRRYLYTKNVVRLRYSFTHHLSPITHHCFFAADKRRSQLKLNRGDAEGAEEKKSLTAEDAKDAKKRLIRIRLQERGGIAKGGIRESF